jgi:hypothetical protein
LLNLYHNDGDDDDDEKHVVPTPLSGIRVGRRSETANSFDINYYKINVVSTAGCSYGFVW